MNTLTTPSASNWLNKVPEATLSFWIIKIMSTTVGEAGADFLAVDAGFGQGMTRTVMGALLAVALFMQLRMRRYRTSALFLSMIVMLLAVAQIGMNENRSAQAAD